MTITALPSAPLPTDSATVFNTKAFTWVSALYTFTNEANSLATEANGYATSAGASATTASDYVATAATKASESAASAANAAAASGVTKWSSGTTYTEGTNVWSPANFQTYRRKTTGAGTTDPASDSTNWTQITASATADPTILHTSDISVTLQSYSANLTAWAGKTTPSGTPLGTTDTQSVTNKTMGSGCIWNGGGVAVQYGGTGAATLTGILRGNGTSAFTAATAGTDYIAPSGALGTPASGDLSNCTADGTNAVGFKNIPQNSKSAAYTLVLGDAGKHIYHPSADTTARTWTIPANSSVAYPIGTAITFVNDVSAGAVTIAITTDTLVLSPAGTTGSRTLAAGGMATALKVTSTRWVISGSGLT